MTKTLDLVVGLWGVPPSTPPTMLPQGSRNDLPKLFTAAGFRRGAEIGVWKGAFAEVLAARIPGVHLLCVDPYESYPEYDEQKNKPAKIAEAEQLAHVRLAGHNVRFMRQLSTEAATNVPDGSLDFIYIDGNHAEAFVRADLEAWTPKVRRGGVVAGHDYRDFSEKPFIQVKPAVDAFTAARGIAPWFVLSGDRAPSFFWVVS